MSDEPTHDDRLFEWRERIGIELMHAMKCTHEGDDFGQRAVCVTCFENTQRVGSIIERECRKAATASSKPVEQEASA